MDGERLVRGKDRADPSQAGREGAEAQSTTDKAKGGKNSYGGN